MRGFFTVVLAAVASLSAQQPTTVPITSARLTLVHEPTTDLILKITNLREVPLVEYAVRVARETTSFHATSESPTNAPVAPGQTREHRIHVPDGEPGSPVEIVRLRFSDVRYQGADQVRSRARLQVERVPGARIVPVVENLRKVPLQAWTVAFLRAGRETSQLTTDMCTASEVRPGQAAIAPGESRRLSAVTRLTEEEVKSFSAEFRMAFFRDGRVEGRSEDANDLLERRKARGATCTRER